MTPGKKKGTFFGLYGGIVGAQKPKKPKSMLLNSLVGLYELRSILLVNHKNMDPSQVGAII